MASAVSYLQLLRTHKVGSPINIQPLSPPTPRQWVSVETTVSIECRHLVSVGMLWMFGKRNVKAHCAVRLRLSAMRFLYVNEWTHWTPSWSSGARVKTESDCKGRHLVAKRYQGSLKECLPRRSATFQWIFWVRNKPKETQEGLKKKKNSIVSWCILNTFNVQMQLCFITQTILLSTKPTYSGKKEKKRKRKKAAAPATEAL